jgi:putative flippase GtrA
MASPAERPTGVTAIAILLFAVAGYLATLAAIMLASPGAVSMAMGASLLNGLELAGPYMFLLVGGVATLIGWGMLRMQNWARRLAIVAAFAGFVMLIPSVSAAAMDFRWSLVWGGLGIIVRMVVVWYLWQTPVAEQFSKLFAKKSKGD